MATVEEEIDIVNTSNDAIDSAKVPGRVIGDLSQWTPYVHGPEHCFAWSTTY